MYLEKSNLINHSIPPVIRPIMESYLSLLETDQDGYIRHPLTAQVGIDPNVRLSTLVASFILGIDEWVVGDNDEGSLVLNPAIQDWYNKNINNQHVWNI